MTDIKRVENVIEWLIEQGIVANKTDLAQKLGYNRSSISHILSGSKPLSDKFIYKLCQLSESVNPRYLLGTDDTMVFATGQHRQIHDFVVDQQKELEDANEKLNAIQAGLEGYRLVPVYNFDAIGRLHNGNEITDAPAYIEKYVPFVGAHEGDICVHVTGNSMIPTYCPGTLMLIRKVEGWRDYFGYGHTFVLFLNDGRRIMKEVRKFGDNPKEYVLCVSHNSEYEPEELPKAMIVSVYKVIMSLANEGF